MRLADSIFVESYSKDWSLAEVQKGLTPKVAIMTMLATMKVTTTPNIQSVTLA